MWILCLNFFIAVLVIVPVVFCVFSSVACLFVFSIGCSKALRFFRAQWLRHPGYRREEYEREGTHVSRITPPPHIYCCYLCYPHHRHYHQYDHCDTYQLIKQRPGPTCNHGLVNRFTGKRRDESYSAFCLQINSLLRSLIEVQEDINLETLTSMKLIYFQNIKKTQ